VINRDSGTEGAALVDMLRAVEFDGKPALDVKIIESEDSGLISLREGKAALVLLIPPGFTGALEDARIGRTGCSYPALSAARQRARRPIPAARSRRSAEERSAVPGDPASSPPLFVFGFRLCVFSRPGHLGVSPVARVASSLAGNSPRPGRGIFAEGS